MQIMVQVMKTIHRDALHQTRAKRYIYEILPIILGKSPDTAKWLSMAGNIAAELVRAAIGKFASSSTGEYTSPTEWPTEWAGLPTYVNPLVLAQNIEGQLIITFRQDILHKKWHMEYNRLKRLAADAAWARAGLDKGPTTPTPSDPTCSESPSSTEASSTSPASDTFVVGHNEEGQYEISGQIASQLMLVGFGRTDILAEQVEARFVEGDVSDEDRETSGASTIEQWEWSIEE